MICEVCGEKRKPHRQCCRDELSRLRNRLKTQSKYIERVEDEMDKLQRRIDKSERRIVTHPWDGMELGIDMGVDA